MIPTTHAIHDLEAIVRRFPDSSETMLIDTRLTDEPEASCRVFRIYREVPAHYHATCDEYLLVISGRGTIFVGDSAPVEVTPGRLVFFKKRTVHGLTVIEHPLDRKSTRLNSSHVSESRMPSSA